MFSLAVDLREIGHRQAGRADAVQQVQPVAPDDLVVGVDLHGFEEGVDGLAEAGHRGHGCGEVFRLHRGRDFRLGGVERGEERLFLVGLGQLRVGSEGVFDAVLVLRLHQDVVGALEAEKQVLAVIGLEEAAECLGAFDQKGQIVGVRHGEAGVDHIVADTFVAEVDF